MTEDELTLEPLEIESLQEVIVQAQGYGEVWQRFVRLKMAYYDLMEYSFPGHAGRVQAMREAYLRERLKRAEKVVQG